MTQVSLLLHFKKSCPAYRTEYNNKKSKYHLEMGLWTNESDEPIIQEIIRGEANGFCGQSLVTRTREGIDRSEGSNHYTNFLFHSTTTFTRESIDRSETSR